MANLYTDVDKYEDAASPPSVVAILHGAIKDLVRRRLDQTGVSWPEFVFDKSYALVSAADLNEIERKVVDGGYRYTGSALISAVERPGAYAPMNEADGASPDFTFEHDEAMVEPVDSTGRQRRGQGDNVVEFPANTIGTARYYRSIQDVMIGLTEGVPEGTIAIIDDSGGTLTAPILEHFHGVICAGGTVRSHLGILTREYGIPCLMNARVSGIRGGDRVELEVSGRAKTAEAYQRGEDMSVRVWKLPAN